jgi:replicative DNA helicase
LSVEANVIAAIVEEGNNGLRKMYQAGVTAEDFPVYEEEVAWLERRAQERKPINVRVFRRKFPGFDWITTDERLTDLLPDLKAERAFSALSTLIDTASEELEVENANEWALTMREQLTEITRLHMPHSDHALLGGYKEHLKRIRAIRELRKQGHTPGIPTGLKWIDFHWDGLVNGRFIVVLGRPGNAKSYLLTKFAWECIKAGEVCAFFSPEMNEHEHICRLHTLASADPMVKEALGLEHSFRNRALMNGVGFNLKKYGEFCEYMDSLPGECHLLTQAHRKSKMSVAYIESRIADLGPGLVLVDPIYKLRAGRKRMSKIEEIADISDALEDLAKAYDVPVVTTNQAHRQGQHRDDAPHKDSSFNSDVPVQEADHVIGVKNVSEEKRMLLRCTKSRFGADFKIELKFYPNTGVMLETSEPQGSYYNGDDEDVDEEEVRKMIDGAVRGEED